MRILNTIVCLLCLSSCSSWREVPASFPDRIFESPAEQQAQAARQQETIAFNRFNREDLGGYPVGRPLDRYDKGRVRFDELITTYYKGRTPSRDRRTMTEAHRIYEVHSDAKWDMRLKGTPRDSLGKVLGVTDPKLNPLSREESVKAELNRQKELTKELEGKRQEIIDITKKLESKVDEVKDYAPVIDELKLALEGEKKKRFKVEENLKASKLEVSRLQTELESLKEAAESLDF